MTEDVFLRQLHVLWGIVPGLCAFEQLHAQHGAFLEVDVVLSEKRNVGAHRKGGT